MKLYFEKHPNLAAEPLLLIHGNLASTVWWGPFLSEWQSLGSKGSAPIYTADWRGCGQNPDWPADKPFQLEDLAGDFLDLLESEKLTRVGLVGHSLGGLIAMQMALLAPEKISKMFLLDPVGAEGVVFDASMYDVFKQMAQDGDLTKTVILSTIKDHEKVNPRLANAIAKDAFKAVKGIGSSVLEILKSVNLSQKLRALKTPTLVVHGELDQIIQPADSEKLSQLLPGAKLEMKADVGHCWNVENPRAFTERVRQWFDMAT